jgi:hypothetical protein
MPTDDTRHPSECPPGESLTQWLKRGSAKQRRDRSQAEQDLHEKARAELRALIPRAADQAKNNKLALLRLIARATKADAALHTETIRALAKLLPDAVIKARAGNPALLRLILRATR